MTDTNLITTLQPLVDRVRTDVTAVKANGRQAWTREPLTRQRLLKHLNGGPARGVCPIREGESTTMVALLDLDSHKGEVAWQAMVDVAERLCGRMLEYGLVAHPWRSSGGSGIHLIVLWDEPQDAYSVRMQLRQVLEQVGLSDGTRGVAHGEVEIFPKQDSVPAGGFGNQFILPLAGKSEPLVRELGYDGGGREYADGYTWAPSMPVRVLERPERAAVAVAAGGDTPRLRQALAAIPNDGEGLSYDDWRDVIFAIHHATNGQGLALAHEFSHRSSKYDGRFLEERVWPFIDMFGGVTELTIYAKAREAGWEEDITEEFEVVAQDEPASRVPDRPWPVFTRDKAGRIEATATNVQLALERSDLTGFQLAYDEFMGRRVIATHDGSAWRAFKDSDYFEIRVQLERLGFKSPGQELVREAVRCVSERRSFDSAIDWGNALVWDGVPRVTTFFERYLGVAPSPYARSVSAYLWTALAGRCMEPGCKVDMVPVLVGPQGSGKTTMVEALAPTDEAFIEINLEHRNEEQTARSLRGKLVGEIAELRGLMTRDSEDIKAWITRRAEEIRALYSEFHAKYWRRLVMIGTGNTDEFLSDETGERRWLPLRVGATDIDALRTDRDQLWAEGIAMWREVGVQWQEAMTLATNEHAAFKVRDTWEEPISYWLLQQDLDGKVNKDRVFSSRDALRGGIGMVDANITKAHEMRVSKVLRTLGYTRIVRWEAGKTCKKWVCAENSTKVNA